MQPQTMPVSLRRRCHQLPPWHVQPSSASQPSANLPDAAQSSPSAKRPVSAHDTCTNLCRTVNHTSRQPSVAFGEDDEWHHDQGISEGVTDHARVLVHDQLQVHRAAMTALLKQSRQRPQTTSSHVKNRSLTAAHPQQRDSHLDIVCGQLVSDKLQASAGSSNVAVLLLEARRKQMHCRFRRAMHLRGALQGAEGRAGVVVGSQVPHVSLPKLCWARQARQSHRRCPKAPTQLCLPSCTSSGYQER